MAQSTAGDHHAALRTMTQAVASMGPLDDDAALVPLHVHRAAIHRSSGRSGEALADVGVAIRLATDLGDAYTHSVALQLRSDIHEERGDLELALAAREEEAILLGRVGNHRHGAASHAARARLLQRLGRHAEAADAVRAALVEAAATGDAAFEDTVRASVVAVDPRTPW